MGSHMKESMILIPKRTPVRVNPVLQPESERRISIDGEWEFRLDPQDKGVKLRWFRDNEGFEEKVQVPGCWQGQGLGHDGTDTIWDFRLRAHVFRATYRGTGWYRRTFRVPEEWTGLRVWLNFGGVHPSADIWLNKRKIGSHSGPFVPFAFDVTDLLRFGGENCLHVRVCEQNRWMGFAYNWQGHWSGLYRSVELTATGHLWIEKLWIQGDPDDKSLRFRVMTGRRPDASDPATLKISVKSPEGEEVETRNIKLTPKRERRFAIHLESALTWSPDSPNLYRVDAELVQGEYVLDAVSERIGFIKLSTKGKHFLINSEPYYMRGSGDFAACPETGSPDTERDRWRKKLGNLRRYGYNYVRCQSYVPTPEYLDVADEVGLIVQSEMGMLGAWSGTSPWHVYAWPRPSPEYRERLKWQWDKTVMRDVNHPAAAIYCMSNELGSNTLYPRTAWKCYRHTKAIKPGAMVIWTDGGYSSKLPGDFVNAKASLDKECKKPVIQHEFRWWSSYPDVRVKNRYSGAVRPYTIELAEGKAKEKGISELLSVMAENSQRLQYLEARGKRETCRRDNPTLAGICHFTVMDIGFSPQGVIDEFYDQKHVNAETWIRSWGDTVVLVDLDFDNRVVAGGDTLRCTFYVSDFSHPPLRKPVLEWELLVEDIRVASGSLRYQHRAFCTRRAGRIETKIPDIAKPSRAKLHTTLSEGRRIFENEWNLWLLPRSIKFPSNIAVYHNTRSTWLRHLKDLKHVRPTELISDGSPSVVLSDQIDQHLMGYVRRGGRVLMAATEGLVRPYNPKLGLDLGRYFFLPPANYPPYEDGQSGTIIKDHPMLGDLPHEGFADLQLYRPIAESPPFDLIPFGGSRIKPVIRALSTYFVCHPLAYLVEFAVGKGGLIATSLDLNQRWAESRYLLASILRYATSPSFMSWNEMSPDEQEELIILTK